MATTSSRKRRTPGAAATGLLLATCGAAVAAPTTLQPTLDLRVVATDNAALTPAGDRRSDLIGDLDAGLLVRRRGPHLNVLGDVGLDFIGYARDTEPGRVLPRGRLDLQSTLIERALFLDGGIDASRTRGDPLVPLADGASTSNTVSTVTVRASPYLALEFSPTLTATLRSDTTITRNKGDDGSGVAAPNGSNYQREFFRVERKPVPLGFALEASSEQTRYQDTSTPALRSDTARATLSAALNPEFIAGVVGGYDHTVYSTTTIDDGRYGVVAQWRPSVRTAFDADVEHQYFGLGWNVHMRHRTPMTILDLTLRRAPSASSAVFGLTGRDDDPAALLGALLSSRLPDVTDRDAAVDAVVASQALPGGFAQPQSITSEAAQLANRAALNLIINGVRNAIYASAYYEKSASLDGAVSPALAAPVFDSRQWGGSLGLFHRLSPTLSGAVELTWSDLEALGARSGQSSKQAAATLSLTSQVNRFTSLSCGLRHFAARFVLDPATGTTQVDENQAFAGLRMQY